MDLTPGQIDFVNTYVAKARLAGFSAQKIQDGLVRGGLSPEQARLALEAQQIVPEQTETPKPDLEVKEYVNENRAKGFSDDQIRTSLMNSGVAEEKINSVLGKKGKVPFYKKPLFVGILALSVLVLILLSVFFISDIVDETLKELEEQKAERELVEDFVQELETQEPECDYDVDCGPGQECDAGFCVEENLFEPQCGDGRCDIGEEDCELDCGYVSKSYGGGGSSGGSSSGGGSSGNGGPTTQTDSEETCTEVCNSVEAVCKDEAKTVQIDCENYCPNDCFSRCSSPGFGCSSQDDSCLDIALQEQQSCETECFVQCPIDCSLAYQYAEGICSDTKVDCDNSCLGNVEEEAVICTDVLPTCADGVDNDEDGNYDLDDPDCLDWGDDEGEYVALDDVPILLPSGGSSPELVAPNDVIVPSPSGVPSPGSVGDIVEPDSLNYEIKVKPSSGKVVSGENITIRVDSADNLTVDFDAPFITKNSEKNGNVIVNKLRLKWLTKKRNIGDHSVSVTITDGKTKVTETVEITVLEKGSAPGFAAPEIEQQKEGIFKKVGVWFTSLY